MVSSDKKSSSQKVLVALSNAALTNAVVDKLKTEGYIVISVKTGEEALEKMKSENPDLALIDLVLSGKNGYDVLNEKSFDRMITKIPVIVVSNAGAPIEMRKIPSTSSVKDYVIKSHVEPDDVMEKVSALFGKKYVTEETTRALHDAPPGKKILWVEDDKFLSSILVKKFESSGHTVLKADNGEQAMHLLENNVPDIIIIDILLPGMDGFEVLQKIKTQEKMKNIPVIILSNTSKPSDLEKAKMLGAQKFLLKAAVSLDEIVREVLALTA